MRILIMGLVLLLAVTVAGCGGTAGNGGTKPGNGGLAYVVIPFEVIKPGQEPAAVAREMDEMRARAATKSVVLDGKTYAIITAGEKSSGGWAVTVESVGGAQGQLEVVYRVTGPAPGSNASTAITYPSAVVRFTNPGNLPVFFKVAQ